MSSNVLESEAKPPFAEAVSGLSVLGEVVTTNLALPVEGRRRTATATGLSRASSLTRSCDTGTATSRFVLHPVSRGSRERSWTYSTRSRRQRPPLGRDCARVPRVVGKEGKLKQRMRVPGAVGGVGRRGRVAQHAHRRPRLADDRGDARHRRGRQGRPHAGDGARGRRAAARRRVSPLRAARQQDDRPALASSRPRSRASRARSAPKASSAGRRR